MAEMEMLNESDTSLINKTYKHFSGSQEFRKSQSPLGLEAALVSTGVNKSSNRFTGLSEFDETQIPELPCTRYSDVDDPLRLSFSEGLRPTTMIKNSNLDKHISGNEDLETALSSDNETFVECQTYQPSTMAYEQFTEFSDMEMYRNVSSSIGQQLNSTIEMKDVALSPENFCTADLTEVEEPMDVDISFSELNIENNKTGELTIVPEVIANDAATDQQPKKVIGVSSSPRPVIPVFEPFCLENINDVLRKTPIPEYMKEDLLEKNEQSTDYFSGSEHSFKSSIMSVEPFKEASPERIIASVNLSSPERTIEAVEERTPVKTIESPVKPMELIKENTPVKEIETVEEKTPVTTIGAIKERTPVNEIKTAEAKTPVTTIEIIKEKTSMNEIEAKKEKTPMNEIKTAEAKTPVTTIIEAIKEKTPISEIETVEEKTPIGEKNSAEKSIQNLNKTIDIKVSPKSRLISYVSQPFSFPLKSPNDKKEFPKTPISSTATKREPVFLEKSDYAESLNYLQMDETNKNQETIINNVAITLTKANTSINETLNKTLPEITPDETLNKKNRRTFNISPSTMDNDFKSSEENSEKRLTFNVCTNVSPQSPVMDHPPFDCKTSDTDRKKRRSFELVKELPALNEVKKRLTYNLESPENEAPPALLNMGNFTEQLEQSNDEFNALSKSSPPLEMNCKTSPHQASFPLHIVISSKIKNSDSAEVSPTKTQLNGEKNLSSLNAPPKPFMEKIDQMQQPSTQQRTSPLAEKSTPWLPPSEQPLVRPATEHIFAKPAPFEPLSAKEKLKISAKDEKDIVMDKFVSTPIEEMTAAASGNNNITFTGFNENMAEIQDTFGEVFRDSNNVVLNEADFDFFFTKGGNNSEAISRDSVLLRFDPLLGLQIQQQQNQSIKLPQVCEIIEDKGIPPTVKDKNKDRKTLFENAKQKLIDLNVVAKSQESQLITPPREDQKKDYVKMSVGVIQDLNIVNDTNKTFDNTSGESDAKHNNFKMDEPEKKIKNENLLSEDIAKKIKESEQKEEALLKRITDKDKTIHKMNSVIEAYEKAIAELIAEKEQLSQQYERQLTEVKADRDSNYQHLRSLETTFSDLHVKYEKSKEMTLLLKSREEALLAEKRQNLENLRLQEARYDKMKNHAMQQLEIANKKLESISKEHSFESTKYKALLKKEEISRASLNEQLQQKIRENAELVKICDELINGQGS